MRSPSSRWLIAGFLMLGFVRPASAQFSPPVREAAPDGENADAYAALRESKNRGTKALTDRYNDLTSLIEWTDKNGKYKVKARYLEHDPDLKWVKLETVTGTGDKRVTKEVQLSLDKLNKVGQSRVRQIAALQTKLDELSNAEDESSTSSDESTASARGERFGRGERGERGERDGGIADEAANNVDGGVDRTQWTTGFPAFRANFKLIKDESGQRVLEWGELQELKSLSENIASETNERREREPVKATPIDADTATRLGEIHWEAPFMKAQTLKSGDHEVRFHLPALPRPLRVRFLLDPEEPYDKWAKMPADQSVQFTGKFAEVSPREIIIRIRQADPAAANATPATEASEHR